MLRNSSGTVPGECRTAVDLKYSDGRCLYFGDQRDRSLSSSLNSRIEDRAHNVESFIEHDAFYLYAGYVDGTAA